MFATPTSCTVQILGCDSLEIARASRSNRSRAPGAVSRSDVARAVDLAHAAGAKRFEDREDAECRAGGEPRGSGSRLV
jgi:hypothetical protein